MTTRQFTDGLGRTHDLDTSIVPLTRIKDELGIDFAACNSAKAFGELCQSFEKPIVACRAMAILCNQEFEEHGKGWTNCDVIEAGQKVLAEIGISYLPSKIRPFIEKAFAKLLKAEEKLREETAKLWKSPEAKAAIKKAVSDTIGGVADVE